MSTESVYRNLVLEALQLQKVQAEVLVANARETPCHAHIEFQLTPMPIEGGSATQAALRVRLMCHGTPHHDAQQRLFQLEVGGIAWFRAQHDAIDFSQFSEVHTVFARQLFPSFVLRAQGLLQDLGLVQIRLPIDLPQQPLPSQIPNVVH